MRRRLRVLLPLAVLAALGLSTGASANHGNADVASPNMFHVANVPPPPQFVACDRGSSACFFSDLAFWEAGAVKSRFHNLVAQGNYEGFRLIDVSDPENPVQVSVVECRANQGDLSFYQANNRLLLIQSIEEPVTTAECETAIETGVAAGTHPITGVPGQFRVPGFEGLRIFDVTRPEAPVLIAAVPTACGSHTHTTIPDERNQRAIVYVSSYPTGARVTPAEGLDFGGPTCLPPHAQISIVEIPDNAPETAHVLKQQPLHEDTLPFRGSLGEGGTGAVGCHDITALYETQAARRAGQSQRPQDRVSQVAGAACLSEGQLWDISDPANPTTVTTHSHIRNEIVHQQGLFHTASFSMDGKVVLFTDEFAGGGGSGCKGEEDPKGNVWFYANVPPGTQPVPLFGRYMFPRVQPPNEACTLHNGNVVPTTKADIGVSSAYQGGVSVFDFTGVTALEPIVQLVITPADLPIPIVAREVAFYEPSGVDGRGSTDMWSAYWHNDYVYASDGLRPQPKRGFDVYKILLPDGQQTPQAGDMPEPDDRQFRARKLRYQNPQTQDTFLETGQGR